MKQLFAGLTILFVFASPNRGLAYKEQTHRKISLESVEASILKVDPDMLGHLGLESLSTGQQFPNYTGRPRTIRELVQDGAAFEDVPGPRVRHHFYNPRTGRPAHSCGLEHGYTSPDWALEDRGQIAGIGPTRHQYDSFADTRQFFLNALTNPVEDERERAWGRTFQGLGQVIHHLEDMTQPQHVRNDMHVVSGLNPPYDPCTGDPSWYEDYTESDGLPFLFYGGYPPVYGEDTVTFNTARSFWDNNGTNDGKGIAEYTNRNFVSAGTNFDQPNALEHPLPETGAEWAEDKTALCQEISQENNIPLPTGFAGQALPCLMTFNMTYVGDSYRPGRNALNKRTSTHSLFTADLRAFNENGIQSYTLNKFNFFEAHQFLIPRAVGYSAGLINYFFRGKIDMVPDPAPNNRGGVRITNLGTEEMEGTFTLYYDDATGKRHPAAQNSAHRPIAWPTTGPSGHGTILQAGESMPVPAFSFPPDGAPEPVGDRVLVFTGRMGQEAPINGSLGAVVARVLPPAPFLLSVDGTVYRSTHLDQGWQVQPARLHVLGGTYLDDTLLFVRGYIDAYEWNVWQSLDNGQSFTPVVLPGSDNLTDVEYLGGNEVVAIGLGGEWFSNYYTMDLGVTWSTQDVLYAGPWTGRMTYIGHRTILAAMGSAISTGSGLYQSTDLGITWSDVDPLLDGQLLSSLGFWTPADWSIYELAWNQVEGPGSILLATGILNTHDRVYSQVFGLWKSVDQGQTWRHIATTPEVDAGRAGIGALALDRQGDALMTVSNLLYRSTDAGETWRLATPPTASGSLEGILYLGNHLEPPQRP